MNVNWLKQKDAFDIHLDSSGSMDKYPHSKMEVFRRSLSHPLQLEAQMTSPITIRKLSQQNISSRLPVFSENVIGGVRVSQDDWSDNATFLAGEYTTIESIMKVLEESTTFYKPFNSFTLREGDIVEPNFFEDLGVSFYDRSVLDILFPRGVPYKHRSGAYFVGNPKKWKKPINQSEKLIHQVLLQ